MQCERGVKSSVYFQHCSHRIISFAGCPLKISSSTLTNWRFVTWDLIVPEKEVVKPIIGKDALKMGLGSGVLQLEDAVTF